MDISNMREEFTLTGLQKKDLSENPFIQFEHWFAQAQKAKMIMPNAMSMASVSPDGQPSVRTVLLKFFDKEGFVFYTNLESQKSKEIKTNAKVALMFPWLELERQVQIRGKAVQVPTAQSVKYFLSRPRGSQLGAWCSNQSSTINSRQMLMSKFEEFKRKFKDKDIPLPSFWGGFRVIPEQIEFWQGRQNRLHDRFLYTLQKDGSWAIERLAP